MDRQTAIQKAIDRFSDARSIRDIHEELFKEFSEEFTPDEAKAIIDEAMRERKLSAARKYARVYDKENANMFRMISFKLNKVKDADVLEKLDSVKSRQGYIKSLVRADIAKTERKVAPAVAPERENGENIAKDT